MTQPRSPFVFPTAPASLADVEEKQKHGLSGPLGHPPGECYCDTPEGAAAIRAARGGLPDSPEDMPAVAVPGGKPFRL